MQHEDKAGGKLEVDHFNPNKKNDRIQYYNNLFPASRHCNAAKDNTWPSKEQQKKGIRFLDCTQERDYGEHIFECPETHKLIATTPAGKYQIENMDLNAPHLVKERKNRAILQQYIKKTPATVKSETLESTVKTLIDELQRIHEDDIPPIPPPPPQSIHL